MTLYTIQVDMPADVPADVVSEYIGQALKKFMLDRTSVTVRLTEPNRASGGVLHGNAVRLSDADMKLLRKIAPQVRQHPFDGPEVFDDDVTIHTFATMGEIPHESIADAYPHLSEVLKQRRDAQITGEGDWQLTDDDRVGDEL